MTPVQMAEAALAADRAHADPAIWILRRADEAILADAAALEVEGPRDRPLWGVPFAVKDNIDVAGMPTTASNIPISPMITPRRAVAGEFIHLIAMMKLAAARMKQSGRKLFSIISQDPAS